jgi:MoaA/NifB/PqqE/SkfB family radical SAM enzyme
LRPDIGPLIRIAKSVCLEVALSTTGDELTRDFLAEFAPSIDLISLPLDGASEEVSGRTKEPGHFAAIMRDLDLLADFPAIDVKVATPVTRLNVDDVPAIVHLLEERTARMGNRLFYNVFQAFPRTMGDVEWEDLLVSDSQFRRLRATVDDIPHSFRINWLSHETLDRLYVMIFPDGTLTVPAGSDYLNYGPFLEVENLDALLARTDFDAPKHRLHSAGWSRSAMSGL